MECHIQNCWKNSITFFRSGFEDPKRYFLPGRELRTLPKSVDFTLETPLCRRKRRPCGRFGLAKGELNDPTRR